LISNLLNFKKRGKKITKRDCDFASGYRNFLQSRN
jgi:hypothetical protein